MIEPDLSVLESSDSGEAALDAHSMNPMIVLRMAKSMGAPLKRILLIACEPETLGPEEGCMGLSRTVEAAVEPAVRLTESIVNRIRNGEWPLQFDQNPA